MKKFIIISFILVLLTSCMTMTSKFDSVQVGMTKDEVLRNYGKPHSRSVDEDGKEYFIYNNVYPSGWSWDTIDYQIVFRNGKVVSYGQREYHAKRPPVNMAYVVN